MGGPLNIFWTRTARSDSDFGSHDAKYYDALENRAGNWLIVPLEPTAFLVATTEVDGEGLRRQIP